MNRFARRVVSLWNQPAVTTLLLGGFFAWAVVGASRGYSEKHVAASTRPVELRLEADGHGAVALRGNAVLAELRRHSGHPVFVNELQIAFRGMTAEETALRLTFEAPQATRPIHIRVLSEDDCCVVTFDVSPVETRAIVPLRLPRGDGALRLVAEHPFALRYVAHEMREGSTR